ncbi:MAG: Fur family transcriptional regulator [Leptolyngbyaceae cyanobacterium]
MKRTRSQNQILDTLKECDRALSAQELYMEIRNQGKAMGLATVYRSLDALKLAGMVQVRTLTNGESLYSMVQEDRHHLTCLQCGDSIPIHFCPVHDLESELNRDYQFKIYYHTLEFFGLCTACQPTN